MDRFFLKAPGIHYSSSTFPLKTAKLQNSNVCGHVHRFLDLVETIIGNRSGKARGLASILPKAATSRWEMGVPNLRGRQGQVLKASHRFHRAVGQNTASQFCSRHRRIQTAARLGAEESLRPDSCRPYRLPWARGPADGNCNDSLRLLRGAHAHFAVAFAAFLAIATGLSRVRDPSRFSMGSCKALDRFAGPIHAVGQVHPGTVRQMCSNRSVKNMQIRTLADLNRSHLVGNP